MIPIGYIGPLRLSSSPKVREWPEQANAFSLPAIREVCKYATKTCFKGCYAKKGKMAFPIAKRAYNYNYQALINAKTFDNMADLLKELISWMKFDVFRIHVSGDFFSLEYTKAWKEVCTAFSDKLFWGYTRVRDKKILQELHQINNLRITLSSDRDNWRKMLSLREAFQNFGLSYYSVGESPHKKLYEKYPELIVFVDQFQRRKVNFSGTCPTEVSSAQWRKEGACSKCRRCYSKSFNKKI